MARRLLSPRAMFDKQHAPGKSSQVEAEPPLAVPGKRSLVEVSALAPERDDYQWEDISDEEFQADAQRAELGPEASALHGDETHDDHDQDHDEQHREGTHEQAHRQPTNTKGEPLKAADPFILVDGARWYEYGTGLTVRSSKDQGATWKNHGKMMSFGEGGRRWAPEVHKIGGKYVAYISISKTETSRIAIYVSTSDDPVHGWSKPEPIAASKQWNNIDATYFHDDKTDKDYLIWKEDRRAALGRKTIVMQELDKSGTHLKANKDKHTLLTAGKGAFSGLERRPAPRKPNWSVEAPTLEMHGGKYWLFYSGAGFERGGGYFVGAASASKITGPFRREPHPLLRGTKAQAEPGHQSIIKVEIDGKTRWLLFFHARGEHGKARYLREDQIVWVNGHPHVKPL